MMTLQSSILSQLHHLWLHTTSYLSQMLTLHVVSMVAVPTVQIPSSQPHHLQPCSLDPQLVGTPATSKAFSDFDEDEEFAGDEGDEDLDRIGAPVTPVKAAGHGKLRKGTVQGGGVVKKSSAYSNAKDKENSGNTRDATIDDGKPPDYQKLSSKEKRQQRNKISARNLRVRRKGRCCHRFPYYLFL